MYYIVDGSNRIVDVDGDWDQSLARDGGGAHAARSRIVGQPLEDFMVGDATKMFVRTALDAARLLGQSRSLPYRCDSPQERRQFEMIVSPADGGYVRVEHRLVDRRSRPLRPLNHGNTAAGWRCSQCLAVRRAGSGDWVDADDAGLGAPLAQDVCPPCASRLFDTAQGA